MRVCSVWVTIFVMQLLFFPLRLSAYTHRIPINLVCREAYTCGVSIQFVCWEAELNVIGNKRIFLVVYCQGSRLARTCWASTMNSFGPRTAVLSPVYEGGSHFNSSSCFAHGVHRVAMRFGLSSYAPATRAASSGQCCNRICIFNAFFLCSPQGALPLPVDYMLIMLKL